MFCRIELSIFDVCTITVYQCLSCSFCTNGEHLFVFVCLCQTSMTHMYIFRSMDVYILAVGVEGIHILRPDDACVFGKYGQTHFFA